jgi:lincosamide nucleotidyltransferase A/C/D/E
MSPLSSFRRRREEDRPRLRTSIANRVNALVWELPVPRRVRVFLSQLVYSNPPISSARVGQVLQALEEAEVQTVLIGGWGIDALSGRQLRPHADLDLLVDEAELERATEVLRRVGYEPWNHNPDPGPIGELHVFTTAQTLRDRALRVVELHAIDLSKVNKVPGTIDGRRVSCLSAEEQLKAQSLIGKTWMPQQRLKRRRNVAAVQRALHRSSKSS